jgi:hypothetical protein
MEGHGPLDFLRRKFTGRPVVVEIGIKLPPEQPQLPFLNGLAEGGEMSRRKPVNLLVQRLAKLLRFRRTVRGRCHGWKLVVAVRAFKRATARTSFNGEAVLLRLVLLALFRGHSLPGKIS